MKRPRYIESLYALIFLDLSFVFIVVGLLCFSGIMKPSAHARVQGPIVLGKIFLMIGIVCGVVQIIFSLIGRRRAKSHQALLAQGNRRIGTVEKVYLQKSVRFRRKSPFRIYYAYSFQGKNYHEKSDLLWDQPDLNEGDSIEVFINDAGKAALRL